jgi:phage terminase large subunit
VATTDVDIGYKPHRFQAEIHAKAKRFTVCVTHRRWGKTYMSCAQSVDAAIRTTKADARFAYLAPYLKQAKQSAWDYLRRFAGSIPGVSIHESELTIRFPNGARITLFGGDNAEALRVGYFDGIVIDEVADLRPDVWGSIIRPALSDRKGWAFFIGTPKGPDFFHTLYEWATSGFPVAGGREKDPK